MKKLFIPFIALLAVSALCCQKPDDEQPAPATAQPTVESAQPTPEPAAPTAENGLLTSEEIFALPHIVAGIACSFTDRSTLRKAYANCDPAAIITCTVTDADYYYGWNSYMDPDLTVPGSTEGYTVINAVVDNVSADYNGIGIKPGDKITIKSGYYLRFANEADRYAFFSEQYGRKITDFSDLGKMESGCFELTPTRGKAYEMVLTTNQMPLLVGGSYSLIFEKSDQQSSDDCLYGFCRYASPLLKNIDFKEFVKDNEFSYEDDYINVVEEVAALFR